MKYKEILNIFAPCGLSCRKCLFNSDGEIKTHSIGLRKLLGEFDRYAERFSELIHPIFRNYQAFKELLVYFTEADCYGCRKGTCKYSRCGVIACYRQKGIDFCFQCDEFPCEKTNFDPDLKRRWVDMNNRMKEIGVEAYYQETKDSSRYK